MRRDDSRVLNRTTKPRQGQGLKLELEHHLLRAKLPTDIPISQSCTPRGKKSDDDKEQTSDTRNTNYFDFFHDNIVACRNCFCKKSNAKWKQSINRNAY